MNKHSATLCFLASSALLTSLISVTQSRAQSASPTPSTSSQPTSQSSRILLDEKIPIDPDAPIRIEDPTGKALDSFFESLRVEESGHIAGRVLISQFGDSHTAVDYGTSRLRRNMQQRFGDAGRGLVWAGRPVMYYDQQDGTFLQEGKWKAENGLRGSALEPLGIMGIRNTYLPPNATKAAPPTKKGKKPTKAELAKEAKLLAQTPKVTVGACQKCPLKNVSRFEVWYRVFSEGGSMKLFLDSAETPVAELSTRAKKSDENRTEYWTLDVEDGYHTLAIQPNKDGNVELFGVVMERDQPGVIVDALGVGGIEASALLRWDWTFIAEHLARRDPSLVIIAYGTNESANTSLKLEKLESNIVKIIQRVKSTVPDASILVMGPPDRVIRDRKDCDKQALPSKKSKTPAKPTPQETSVPEGCQWYTPKIIPEIVEVERRAAMKEGVAFFDSYLAMGGSGSMEVWYRQTPALASKDRIHLNRAGYETVADMLFEALMVEYESYVLRAVGPAR